MLDRPQPPSDSNCSIVKHIMGVVMCEAPSENYQNVGFEFATTSISEWNSIFQNFQNRGQPWRYTQIFEKIFPQVFFPFHFAPGIARIFGWKVRISEIQQFPELQETFRGNFCTICHCSNFSIACEYSRVSLLLAARNLSARSKEKPLYSQANFSKVSVEWKVPKATCN